MNNEPVVYDRSLGGMVRSETQAFIPVKSVYTPEDIKDTEYERDLGDPGCYPFTRGIGSG